MKTRWAEERKKIDGRKDGRKKGWKGKKMTQEKGGGGKKDGSTDGRKDRGEEGKTGQNSCFQTRYVHETDPPQAAQRLLR